MCDANRKVRSLQQRCERLEHQLKHEENQKKDLKEKLKKANEDKLDLQAECEQRGWEAQKEMLENQVTQLANQLKWHSAKKQNEHTGTQNKYQNQQNKTLGHENDKEKSLKEVPNGRELQVPTQQMETGGVYILMTTVAAWFPDIMKKIGQTKKSEKKWFKPWTWGNKTVEKP